MSPQTTLFLDKIIHKSTGYLLYPSLILLTSLLVLVTVKPSRGLEGDLSSNQTWTAANSPYTIDKDVLVPAEVTLRIAPGTQILFSPGTSLIIEGELHAVGSLENPILFSSVSESPTPGSWGQIRFVTVDTTLSYNDDGAYVKGSEIRHAIIEYGGRPKAGTPTEFQGGAIHCRKSSPYLSDLILRYNSSPDGGAIYCHEFASPYIINCLFKDNEADKSGGALACFFYSNAYAVDNIFVGNKAGEHGGAIYFAFSSPQIINNIIENNKAHLYGGGIHCSNTVTQAISRVRHNVLLSNRSDHKANGLYLTAKIETIFQENVLFAGEGYDLYIDALEKDLDFRGNYFGPPSRTDVETRIYDGYDDPAQKGVNFEPVLESPPPDLPNEPVDVSSLELLGNESYSIDWPLPLCDEAPIFLEARAKDMNPYHPDWLPVRLRSSNSDPAGIVVLAWETGPSTGVFRVEGKVGSVSLPQDAQIKALPGETLTFGVEGYPKFDISRKVDVPRSYIISLRMPEEADTMHVVNHTPAVSWAFRDIFGRKQKNYQMQLSDGSVFMAPPVWDSDELMGSKSYAKMLGAPLVDGATYTMRVRLFNGDAWSDWSELTFRMNSLPPMPVVVAPANDEIVRQINPSLTIKTGPDAEGDKVLYELQLSQYPDFVSLLSIDKEITSKGASYKWIPPTTLGDNAEYYWRARSADPFEEGKWCDTGHFWVNTVDEPPLPFSLLDPKIDIEVYLQQPVFSWEETTDPDPMSTVSYRVYYSKDPGFSAATTLTIDTEETWIKCPKVLTNAATYHWKVEAIDNTNLKTTSNEAGSFFVNTTPSVPVIIAPLAGEELRPDGGFSWQASTDPNPDDVITYRVQVTAADFSQPLAEETTNDLQLTIAQLTSLDKFKDDAEYKFRLRAEDNHAIVSAWSDPIGVFFLNKENDPPGIVNEPIGPNDVTIKQVEPILSWGAAVDPDRSDPPGKLSYLIQFDDNDDFREGVRQVQVMAGVTRVAIPNLADNQRWFYRIAALDNEGATSPWCEPKTFVLNTEEEPPLPFALISPDDGMKTYQLTGQEFKWEEVHDPDPYDSLNYRIYIADAESPDQPVFECTSAGTNWIFDKTLKDNVDYVWWVDAVDKTGLSTRSSKSYNFSIDTTPSEPVLTPVLGGIITGEAPFKWQASTDPNPEDKITYSLRLTTADESEDVLIKKDNIAETSTEIADITKLTDDKTYAVKVQAIDQNGAVSDWSNPVEFELDLINSAPSTPDISEPKETTLNNTKVKLKWAASSDPDPSDSPEMLNYVIQYGNDPEFSGAAIGERTVEGTETTVSASDNKQWYFRVKAVDRRGAESAWCSPVSVVVNVKQDPPSEPTLDSPANGTSLESGSAVEFNWSKSDDPDPGAIVEYDLIWWPEGQSRKTSSQKTGDLKATVTGIEPGIYQWQVTAMDDTGLKTTSTVNTFIILGVTEANSEEGE